MLDEALSAPEFALPSPSDAKGHWGVIVERALLLGKGAELDGWTDALGKAGVSVVAVGEGGFLAGAQPPPAPDLFIHAANSLGVEPGRCVAVVKSDVFRESALRAGCQVLRVMGEANVALDVESCKADDRTDKADRTDKMDEMDLSRLLSLSARRLYARFFSAAETLYADVAVAIPVHQNYTYRVPEGLRANPRIGSIVRVPVRNKECAGVIVRIGLHTAAPKKRLKSIAKVLCPEYHIPPDLLALGEWMGEYYLGSLGETLQCISFFGLREEHQKTERRIALSEAAMEALENSHPLPAELKLTARQKEVCRFFVESLNEFITRSDLMRREGCSVSVVDALLDKGVLVEDVAGVERDDAYSKPIIAAMPHPLNDEQQVAFAKVMEAVEGRKFAPYLLHGITGSGKTEIYLQVIQKVLEAGRQAIVLVPEISLTPQAVERFRGRFGKAVGVYHSNLSSGQKYDLWRRIECSEVSVLIGARSAVFAPFAQLGLIVVDEEHEHSYKQSDPAPRYHARDVAVWRARFAGIPVILGSATPSLEAYQNVRKGKFILLELKNRAGVAQLPHITLVDMAAQVRDDRLTSLISQPLLEAMRRRLDKGEQVILFLNRRGFANFMFCMACKTAMRCAHCDVVMTWHKALGKMMCHFCGEMQPPPKVCPECGEPDPKPMGMGTQRIEEEVRGLFPEAGLLRIDLDTTRGKHGFLRLWEKIEEGKADILLGTQMIAKGLHLEKVTLVGVISADHSLFLPDFRSAERCFAQLTQVAGRAGRMAERGEVIIQTFMPGHYAIRRAIAHDQIGFYEQELHMREMLRFPPHWRLLLARLEGLDAKQVAHLTGRLAAILKDAQVKSNAYRNIMVLGPAPCPIERIKDQTRWQILLRGQAPGAMRKLMQAGLGVYDKEKNRRGVSLTLDMDPMDLL